MALLYSDTIELPGEVTLAQAEDLDEYLTGIGWTNRVGRTLGFEIERDDLWEMREILSEIEGHLSAYGFYYTADKDKVREKVTA